MGKSRKDLVQEICLNAVITTLFAVLTIVISPLSYGPIQLRFSEILVLFCFFNKRYSIGLVLGCLIANCFSPTASLDIIFGTIALGEFIVMSIGYAFFILLKRSQGFLRAIKANQNLEVKF